MGIRGKGVFGCESVKEIHYVLVLSPALSQYLFIVPIIPRARFVTLATTAKKQLWIVCNHGTSRTGEQWGC
jgi:hypothetical protein